MRKIRRPRVAALATAALLVLFVAGAGTSWAANPGSQAAACSPFGFVKAPKVVGANVASLAATSSSDVWAVGLGKHQPTILHWDGTTWAVSPQDSGQGTGTGVAAISPTDAWTVGYNGSLALAKHWDGSLWRSVSVPVVGTQDTLTSVTALSTDDVWAAGYYVDGPIHPLVYHWDGISWTQVPAPDGVTNSTNSFYGISAVSAQDIWAAGFEDTSFLHFEPLIEHWDGTSWSVIPSPVFPGNDNMLFGVSARATDDVWVVGFKGDTSTELRTLAEHWNGTSWSVVFTPDLSGTLDLLAGVDAVSGTDAWAVGERHIGTPEATAAEHWDGTRWRLVKSPPTSDGAFGGVLAVTPTEVWAVGGVSDPSISDIRPLTMLSAGCGQP
jgi:hypothetical protein